jgi:putative addiction module CopG family antidote
MPSKHNLNVSVTEHLASFVAAQLASGRFSSASEVVRAGLRLLERDLATALRTDVPADGLIVPSGPAASSAAAPQSRKARRGD